MESELFGHEKGAFTNATATKIGRIEMANGGTLFLNEVQNLSLEMQAKLLEVVESGRFYRVGGHQEIVTVQLRLKPTLACGRAGKRKFGH